MQTQRPGDRGLRIGLVYETFETYPRLTGEPFDAHAEYEPEATIEALEASLHALGHVAIRLGAPHALLEQLGRGTLPRLDAALNIAEGHGSRNREAWAPALLEMAGVPCLGSDALTLSLTLDKAWANQAVAAAGLLVAPQCVMACAEEARAATLPADFPLFVKPRWEGTSKGIRRSSRVEDRAALAVEVARIVRDYAQPALVEAFLAGAEYTVTVVGHAPPRALAVLQRALEVDSRIGLHALEAQPPEGEGQALAHCVPGDLDPDLEARLRDLALQVFGLFECRDFARADFRLDGAGQPVFLEINPLPTFAPDGSFGILAEIEGRSMTQLLAEVLEAGLARLGLSTAASPGSVAPAAPARSGSGGTKRPRLEGEPRQ